MALCGRSGFSIHFDLQFAAESEGVPLSECFSFPLPLAVRAPARPTPHIVTTNGFQSSCVAMCSTLGSGMRVGMGGGVLEVSSDKDSNNAAQALPQDDCVLPNRELLLCHCEIRTV